MPEREPALLRPDDAAPATPRASSEPATEIFVKPTAPRGTATVHVVGFWKRFAAAMIDFAVITPVALLITFVVGKIAGVSLAARPELFAIDRWIDLVLATDPALVMWIVLFNAIGLFYLLACHIMLGRTLGMRVLKIRVIDVYGDRPSPARCAARCAGYLASAATLFLGFLWMGFDSEKRGLQDWIAGTYVIRA